MLPEVVEVVGERVEVLVDGGVRRGTDVLKALALGARAVLSGRPILWALAVGGEEGVTQVLELLRIEIETGLKLLGCAGARMQVTRAHVRAGRPVRMIRAMEGRKEPARASDGRTLAFVQRGGVRRRPGDRLPRDARQPPHAPATTPGSTNGTACGWSPTTALGTAAPIQSQAAPSLTRSR